MKHDDEAKMLLRLLDEAHIGVDQVDMLQCLRHLDWVLTVNERVNLTAITNRADAARLHVLDSLMVVPEVDAAPPGLLVDLGAGGGYPGVPLAIATGRQTLLVDSVAKKLVALEPFLVQEGLDGRIKAFKGRSEELATANPQLAAVVIARAVSTLPTLMEWASPLLELGGQMLAMKAQFVDDEVDRASAAAAILGFSPPVIRSYVLPGGAEHRSIVSFTRDAEPTIALPRRVGVAKKKPVA